MSELTPSGPASTPHLPARTRLENMALPGKILIVDDDASIRRILSTTLKKRTVILEAADGAQALEIVPKAQPEFIVTDLNMPRMNGLELLREVRRSSFGASIPVLVLTSNGEEEILVEAFQLGADDYVMKPFSIKELTLRISSIHMRQQLARDVNPLTRLPGNQMLKRELEARIRDRESVAVAYVDLDNFKAFNDYQGFDRGDLVIQLVADILRSFASSYPPGEVFIGHIGGDDFVVFMAPSEIGKLSTAVFAQFTDAILKLYTPADVERGYFQGVNRRGELENFGLLSVSIGVLMTNREGLNDLRRISQVAAEVKKMAKTIPGNSIFVDRRTTPADVRTYQARITADAPKA
ncbi:MAG: response regulator [Planctomycetota bacterium]